MFTSIRHKIARFVLAASVIFILAGSPVMPITQAAECSGGGSSAACSG